MTFTTVSTRVQRCACHPAAGTFIVAAVNIRRLIGRTALPGDQENTSGKWQPEPKVYSTRNGRILASVPCGMIAGPLRIVQEFISLLIGFVLPWHSTADKFGANLCRFDCFAAQSSQLSFKVNWIDTFVECFRSQFQSNGLGPTRL